MAGPVPKLRVDLAQAAELEELHLAHKGGRKWRPEQLRQLQPGFSPEFLRHYCDTQDLDLEQVTYLEIQADEPQSRSGTRRLITPELGALTGLRTVDSATQSLELLGEHLPKLRQLKLTDPSSVLSLRDLGSSLKHLEILWLSRCGLQDLGGASALLPGLRELYLSFNDVVAARLHQPDATPLSGCERLEVLDLEGNAIADEEDVRALGSCSHLRELNLGGNPVYRASCKAGALTRDRVIELLPNLEVLDDLPTKASLVPRSFDCMDSDVDDPSDVNFLSRGTEVPASELEEGRDLGSDDDQDEQEPQHPLLVAGFADRRAAGQSPDPFAGEPDETELILEQLKRARRRAQGHAFTARPAFGSAPSAGFGIHLPSRRMKTAENQEGFRPATASNSRLRFEDMMPTDSASDLTCGETLAGNPLRALRQRHPSGASTAREAGMDIRELLQRYQTYTWQCSTFPPELLRLFTALASLSRNQGLRAHAVALAKVPAEADVPSEVASAAVREPERPAAPATEHLGFGL
ncbi:LRRC56 [Symbiodinium natans]|uniref:LRRC56 protein n=1 Tax=Symbiodinium natans TaxID=878477 RepID=A0A812JAQ4_9DINO|nr:LRRC56 [Symbiodinium natans]